MLLVKCFSFMVLSVLYTIKAYITKKCCSIMARELANNSKVVHSVPWWGHCKVFGLNSKYPAKLLKCNNNLKYPNENSKQGNKVMKSKKNKKYIQYIIIIH